MRLPITAQSTSRTFRCLLACGMLGVMAGCAPAPSTPPPNVSPLHTEVPKPSRPTPATVSIHRFRDATEQWGMNFTRDDDIGPMHRILESNGGGVGVIDYDMDGWPDLLLTNGCPLPLSKPVQRTPDALFRNRAGQSLHASSRQAGIDTSGYHHGCTVADWNSDGFPDLYIAALGPNKFYVNQGDGTFLEQATALGIAGDQWSSSPVFADLDQDGLIDLYVTNYVQTSDDPPRLCPEPQAPDKFITCPPTVFEGEPDVCYRSDGQGGFEDVTQTWQLTGDAPKGLGCVVADFDQNNVPEIYIANDGVPNFLFSRDQADQPFRNEALIRGLGMDSMGRAQGSMGLAVGDTDRDGWLDILVSNFYSEPNAFYHGTGQGNFEEIIKQTQLAAPSLQMLGFGTLFLDPDNDGWLDLFVANGHIDDMRWRVASLPYRMPPQLFENRRNGTFREVSPTSGDYFQKEWLGRGVATVDLNQDGRVDLVVSHQLDRSSIVINETPAVGRFLSIRCIGTSSNRSALSTKLWLETDEGTRYHEIIGGGSYNSAPDLRAHFGLGQSTAKTLRIRWQSGTEETVPAPAPGQYTLIEGQGLLADPVVTP